MVPKYYFGILLIVNSAELHDGLKNCKEQTKSANDYYLAGHLISTVKSSSLAECVMLCSYQLRCKSLNFQLSDMSCDLNEADRHTHQENYERREASVYMDTPEKHRKKGGFKSCAEIHQELPQAASGYYWLKIGNRDAQVYCDMDNYGGGWTLAVSISSKNNDHLQRNANNCLNSILCVPLADNNHVTSRKLSDEDIHKLAETEGTFRVHVLNTQVVTFYQIPSGPKDFNSSCARGDCPRIITSSSYPYQWETNPCTSIDVGYRLKNGCHSVFDGHDDHECGSVWRSSGLKSGKRALYGYPCPEKPQHDSLGLYYNSNGMLYVK